MTYWKRLAVDHPERDPLEDPWKPPAADQAEWDLLEDHFQMNRNAPEGPQHSHVLQGWSRTHSHPGGEKSHGYDDQGE